MCTHRTCTILPPPTQSEKNVCFSFNRGAGGGLSELSCIHSDQPTLKVRRTIHCLPCKFSKSPTFPQKRQKRPGLWASPSPFHQKSVIFTGPAFAHCSGRTPHFSLPSSQVSDIVDGICSRLNLIHRHSTRRLVIKLVGLLAGKTEHLDTVISSLLEHSFPPDRYSVPDICIINAKTGQHLI